MLVLVKIAIRNIIKNKKRSLLIGIAIFIPSLILLLTNAVFNGVEEQTLKSYINIQVGEVAVMWSKVKEFERDKPDRIYNSHFDADRDEENRRELTAFYDFIAENKSQIKAWFPTIFRSAVLPIKKKNLHASVYGISQEDAEFLISTKTLKMEQGEFITGDERVVCISSQFAKDYNLKVGDEIFLDCNTVYGAKNRLDFVIKGIYANGPGWLNSFIYMQDRYAREFFDFDSQYFDIARIFFYDPRTAIDFVSRLNAELAKHGSTLIAEHYLEASTFFPSFVNSQRNLYAVFSVFLLFVIALGIRSTVRMNLFERMAEFATIRAIGYSRFKSFLIIFFEILFLSIFSLIVAWIVAFVITLVLRHNGVYVGTGPMSYMFGGDRFYPLIRINDLIMLTMVLFLLSVFAPFKPGISLCYQKIADILVKRQRRFLLSVVLIKKFLHRMGLITNRIKT
jgi:putative ABC transport system permease protein